MITPRFILLTLARSFAVAVLAYALGFLLPKQYSSDMALYFPSAQQKASGGLAALAGGAAGGDADGGSIPVLQNAASSPLVGSGPASATGIMTSRTCLFEVIQKLDLQTKWGMSNKWNAYNRLARAIGIRTDKNGFLKVECTEEDPELCKSIVDAVRAHLDKRASQLTLNVAKKNRELVEQQIKKADDEVARVTTKMEAALAQGPVGSLDIVGKNYLDIQTKLIDSKALAKSAEESIASQEQSLKRIYGAAGSKDPTALESAGVEASKAMGVLAEELQKRRIEMSDTARKFTQGSPEYKAASRRLRDVESVADQEMRKQTESIGAGTNTKLVAAKAQLIALKASQALVCYRENRFFSRTMSARFSPNKGIPHAMKLWTPRRRTLIPSPRERGC
ncbi:MAG: hypothetical protein K8R88_03910 [Armatimonadetes bacterium]|nr:hypothetical protein [Armatimonadota bacterium]